MGGAVRDACWTAARRRGPGGGRRPRGRGRRVGASCRRPGVPALGGVRRLARARPRPARRRVDLSPLQGDDDRGGPGPARLHASTRWRCRCARRRADRPARRARPTSRPACCACWARTPTTRDPLRAAAAGAPRRRAGLRPDPETERLTARRRAAADRGRRPSACSPSCAGWWSPTACSTAWRWPTGSACSPRCCPSSTALHGVEQSHFHHLDVLRPHARGAAPADRARGDLGACSATARRGARACWPSRWPTSSPAARRCASARCFHDIGKPATRGRAPRRARHLHRPRRRGRARWCAQILPPPAHERAAARASSARSPATTWCSASWCTSARSTAATVYRYLRRMRAGRGGGHAALLRRPPGHPRGRKAELAIAAHLELARELMAAALDWRDAGPAAAAAARRRAGARAGHRARARARRAAAPSWRRPPTPARSTDRDEARGAAPAGCAKIPRDDRRLRRVRATGSAATASVELREACERCRDDGRVRLDRPATSPPRRSSTRSAREFELHELAVEDAIHAHQRPKLEVYGDTVFVVLKTARYVDPEEVVRVRRDPDLPRRRTSSSPCATARPATCTACARRSRPSPSCCAAGPGAVLHAIVDRVVDDYVPGDRGPRRRHRGGRERGVLGRARATPPSASTSSSARCSSSTAPPRPLVEPVDRLAGGQLRPDPPRGRAYFRDVNDHLIRGARAARGLPRPAHQRARGQPHPGHRAPERGHAQDLGAGWRSSPCPR